MKPLGVIPEEFKDKLTHGVKFLENEKEFIEYMISNNIHYCRTTPWVTEEALEKAKRNITDSDKDPELSDPEDFKYFLFSCRLYKKDTENIGEIQETAYCIVPMETEADTTKIVDTLDYMRSVLGIQVDAMDWYKPRVAS